jgi:hypothetical protein
MMSFRVKAVLWTIASVITGTIGGYIAEYLTAPFYAGFLFTFVLTGLVALFALAVHVTNEQIQKK